MKKRIISAFLAAVMGITANTVILAADENGTNVQDIVATAEADASKYQKDIDIMSALGLFSAFPDRNADSTVTRGTFAAAVADLLNLDESYKEAAVSNGQIWFTDVNESDSNYKNIAALAQYGLISGDGGYFYPDRNITYAEAVKILVSALGYDVFAIQSGGYPAGYFSVASEVDVTENMTASGADALTVGEAARLLKNTGNAKLASYDYGDDSLTMSEGKTLFWANFKIGKGKGLLTANSYTSVHGSKPAGTNRVKIGDFSGLIYYNNNETELLGYNVEYYYCEENDDNVVAYIAADEKLNDVMELDAEEIKGFNSTTSQIEYFKNDKIKTETIPRDASVIFNGKLTIDYFYKDNNNEEKSIFDMENGEIKLIDNNSDGKTDVVSILSYENYVISAVDRAENKIYDKYDASKVLDLDKIDNCIITDISGNILSIDDIKPSTILSAALSYDKKIMRAVLSEKQVQESFVSKREKDGEIYVTLGKNEYKVCSSYKKALPNLGNSVVAYLDYAGKVADFSSASKNSDYAFIMNLYVEDDRVPYIKLLTSDGKQDSYALANKVKIEGISYTGAALLEKINNMGDFQVAICKFKINPETAERTVYLIDTVETGNGSDDDKLVCVAGSDRRLYYDTVRTFVHGNSECDMAVDSNTVGFKTPLESEKDRKEDYAISAPSGFGISYTVAGYTTDPNKLECEAVHYFSNASQDFSTDSWNILLVNEVYTGMDVDENEATVVSGYYNGALVERTFASDSISRIEPYGPDDIKPGMMIQYAVNSDGEISQFDIMTSLTAQGELGVGLRGNYDNKRWLGHDKLYVGWGYLAQKSGSMLGLSWTRDKLSTEPFTPDMVWMITNSTNVYVLHKSNTEKPYELLNKGDVSLLMDYKNNHQEMTVIAWGNQININNLVIVVD